MATMHAGVIEDIPTRLTKDPHHDSFVSDMHLSCLGLKSMFDETTFTDAKELKLDGTIEKKQIDDGGKQFVELSKKMEKAEVPEDHPIIYMKQLDTDLCIEFNSPEGRRIFKHAICKKYMNIYFTLAPHFHTQCEPNLCGVGSLNMVLNALKVDPRRMWKYPWRWYDEYMINTCVSVDVMVMQGVSFDEYMCIARCNKLSTESVLVSKESSIEEFRRDIKRTCHTYDTVLLLNYARSTFNQTGTGHYTPIGGYDAKRDLVLILDTARFKLPPHWVSVNVLWISMQQIAVGTKGHTEDMPRGYFLLQKNEQNPNITIKFANNLKLCLQPNINSKRSEIEKLITAEQMWNSWLDSNVDKDHNIIQNSLKQLIDISVMSGRHKETKNEFSVLGAELKKKLSNTNLLLTVKSELEQAPGIDIKKLEATVGWIIETFITRTETRTGKIWNILRMIQKQSRSIKIPISYYDNGKSDEVDYLITAIILFWPYKSIHNDSNRENLQHFVEDDLQRFPKSFISTAHQQIRLFSKTLRHMGHDKEYNKDELYFD